MQKSLMDRLMGVVTLKAPVYREIAEDPAAMQPAVIIVVAISVISGLLGGLIGGNLLPTLLSTVVSALLGWVIGGFLTSIIANAVGGKTNPQEMLRITGHTQVFQILAFIPCLGTIAALVLGIIANVLAIREAAEVDNTKAIIVAVLVALAVFAIAAVISLVLGGGSAALSALQQPR